MGIKLFGEILIANNVCKEEHVLEALAIQKEIGGKIGTVLLNSGIISEPQLFDVLSEQLGVELYNTLDRDDFTILDFESIPSTFFVNNKIYPFEMDKETLFVGVDDIFKIDAFSFIESQIQKSIKPYLLYSDEQRHFENQYELDNAQDVFDADEDEVDKLKELASEAPVIKLVNNFFTKAIKARASDIHYESYKDGIKVRFRIDGRLTDIESVPLKMKLAIIARLKLISKMNISENRLPQDGRISLKIAGQEFDVRSSSVPTAFGESFVLRLLGKQAISYSLEGLDFYKDSMDILTEISKAPNGIFLTTGPTGSGKTTTLYSLLNDLHTEDTKIITVEDPVEYELHGISQIQVRADIGFNFSNALRSILRQDPDIIMIGEIRDLETAQIAVQAALTGHLVISTLHTNSALGAITRLLDMGVDYFLLKSSIVGLMA
ncbi:Flp pilus assembly complex ATPase component TadA, partial [Sulfurimonas sp. MAG313]